MNYEESAARLAQYRRQIAELRSRMREVQSAVEPQEVAEYEFATNAGKTLLSELFREHDTLFVIHNMGRSCAHCTMWADGFNGVFEYVRDRAAFVVVSPDAADEQQKFAVSRGWRFPMVSTQGTSFAHDMGYSREGRPLPGISVFKRKGDRIMRVSGTSFSPGDDFCTVWHFFDLLPEGAAGWRPRFEYTISQSLTI